MSDKKKVHWPSIFDAVLIYGGAIVIVLMVTFLAADPFERTGAEKRLQIAIVGLGLVANQIGVWHVASNLFSGRRYFALRDEVDGFIGLVRRMNTLVIEGDREQAEEVTGEMHAAVDRMLVLAGKEGPTSGASSGDSA